MIKAIIYALSAAAFYAISTPVSKILLNNVPAPFMAAFLYLGAGVGVGIMYLLRRKADKPEDKLRKADFPYVLGMILLDIAAPILLMFGIKLGNASNAALLGNFEIAATALIALLAFRETVTKKLWIAIGFIIASSIILTFEGAESISLSYGSLLVLLATVCWGLENNCTRKISDRSTYQIVILKGAFSGGGAFVIALVLGEKLPRIEFAIPVMLLGFVAYGLSIFLYIRAQRTLGAAKTSAYYAVAPFIGALLSFLLLNEKLTGTYLLGLVIMLIGTALAVWDTITRHHRHSHAHLITHTHNGVTHTHTIEHYHGHDHYLKHEEHTHHHSRQELLSECGHEETESDKA